jgi:hypothetical protein
LKSLASSAVVTIGAHLLTRKNPQKGCTRLRKSNTGTGPKFLRLPRFPQKVVAGFWILVLIASMAGWLVGLVWFAYLLVKRLVS